MVEGMTDNRNRTAAELRKVFERNNGVMGQSGTAGWAFDRKGVILVDRENVPEDQIMELAVGNGADDYSDIGEAWQVTTSVETLSAVTEALEAAKLVVKSSAIQFLPKTLKQLAGRDGEVALQLAEALDDHDDVQNVYIDFDVAEG
jgi:transcriptional/translational regulatory protein YebC/TACO1